MEQPDHSTEVLLESQEQVLDDLFTYHAPTPEQLPKYDAIRKGARYFASIVLANCPSSADRSAALRQIRQAMMTANASIALHGRGF